MLLRSFLSQGLGYFPSGIGYFPSGLGYFRSGIGYFPSHLSLLSSHSTVPHHIVSLVLFPGSVHLKTISVICDHSILKTCPSHLNIIFFISFILQFELFVLSRFSLYLAKFCCRFSGGSCDENWTVISWPGNIRFHKIRFTLHFCFWFGLCYLTIMFRFQYNFRYVEGCFYLCLSVCDISLTAFFIVCVYKKPII